MNSLIEQKLAAIRMLCREYWVARLEVFGSICTPEFEQGRSDVDFLVTYPSGYDYGPWMGRVQDLEVALGALLGRNVDLVMVSALKNTWFRREAEKTRTVIFDVSEVLEAAGSR